MLTFSQKPLKIKKMWIVIDATNLILGRLAVYIANRLRGKDKVTYTPHVDCGDNVIVINSKKIALTGKKINEKKYFWYTGYIGGIKQRTAKQILEDKFPERLIKKAVERMIPRGPLGRRQMRNLYLYPRETHPHIAQQPQNINFGALKLKNKRIN